MTVARLLADENFPRPTVDALRRLGHEVRTLGDIGVANVGLPDHAVLEISIQERRALLTLNRLDFLRLHRARPDHAGLVVCTFDRDFDAQAARIDDAITKSIVTPKAASELAGMLIRVNLT